VGKAQNSVQMFYFKLYIESDIYSIRAGNKLMRCETKAYFR